MAEDRLQVLRVHPQLSPQGRQSLAEVVLPPPQAIKLGSTAREQKGRDEDIILWLALTLFLARLRFRLGGLENTAERLEREGSPADGPRAPGDAHGPNPGVQVEMS